MAWLIQCANKKCGGKTKAQNIVVLISSHRDKAGWFVCGKCNKSTGYIEKKFSLQEGGVWEPYLRGVIPLGEAHKSYQPFVFLVSYKQHGPANNMWFSYYKDLRGKGGRLKLGYGPGGPPVLNAKDILRLIGKLVDVECITWQEIKKYL